LTTVRTVLMLTTVAVVASGQSVVGAVRTAATGHAAATKCSELRVPVSVPGGSGPIAGTLCQPPGATTVQLLVHGYTYGRYYWAMPQVTETYSYAWGANLAGYATFALDRIGIGASWHPPSPLITYDSNVSAVHQVVRCAGARSARHTGRSSSPGTATARSAHFSRRVPTTTSTRQRRWPSLQPGQHRSTHRDQHDPGDVGPEVREQWVRPRL
jgi:hypothetical protein